MAHALIAHTLNIGTLAEKTAHPRPPSPPTTCALGLPHARPLPPAPLPHCCGGRRSLSPNPHLPQLGHPSCSPLTNHPSTPPPAQPCSAPAGASRGKHGPPPSTQSAQLGLIFQVCKVPTPQTRVHRAQLLPSSSSCLTPGRTLSGSSGPSPALAQGPQGCSLHCHGSPALRKGSCPRPLPASYL